MKKWCCAAETSVEVYIFKLHSELDNTSPHFALYGKNNRIHELRTFGFDIYPITFSPKKLYYTTQELSFMDYNTTIATMKWRYPNTKKLKYVSSEIFDEHNNKFGKV